MSAPLYTDRTAVDPQPQHSESSNALRQRNRPRFANDSGPLHSDSTTTIASLLIAAPMFLFGVQHFIYLTFVANFIPAWIPFHYFWACFTGVALIAAAFGIVLKRWALPAATLLGTMIFLWVLLLHTSRIAAQPGEFAEWRGIFQALALSGCALALAASLEKQQNEVALRLKTLSDLGAKAAPWFLGAGIAALGAEHFLFQNVAAPQVPVWIPRTTVGNYLSGAALLVCGAGICTQRYRRRAALILALLVGLSMLLVHLPVVLRSPRFESDWTKTLAITGGALLLAKTANKTQWK